MSLVFIPSWLCYINDTKKIGKILKNTWWKYLLLALVDVEANYFIIKAYQMTIVTTIQVYLNALKNFKQMVPRLIQFKVIDAFVLPIAVVLSYFLLKQHFKMNHVIGVIACLIGCGLIIMADTWVKDINKENHRLIGDLLCLVSSILYAISNVGAEYLLKSTSKREYLAMIGFFGTIISILQM